MLLSQFSFALFSSFSSLRSFFVTAIQRMNVCLYMLKSHSTHTHTDILLLILPSRCCYVTASATVAALPHRLITAALAHHSSAKLWPNRYLHDCILCWANHRHQIQMSKYGIYLSVPVRSCGLYSRYFGDRFTFSRTNCCLAYASSLKSVLSHFQSTKNILLFHNSFLCALPSHSRTICIFKRPNHGGQYLHMVAYTSHMMERETPLSPHTEKKREMV